MLRLAATRTPAGIWSAARVAAALRARAPAGQAEAVRVVFCEPGSWSGVSRTRLAVLSGEADAAVHPADELPCPEHGQLEVIAVLDRGDPREALCGRSPVTLAGLAPGARVGASGLRRLLQLSELRPDLEVVAVDGDAAAALRRVGGDLEAVVVPAAALVYLSLQRCAAVTLPLDRLVPAAGQATLAVEALSGHKDTLGPFVQLDHAASRVALAAERAVLRRLQAWPSSSAGVLAVAEYGSVTVHGVLAHGNGQPVARARRSGPSTMLEQVADAVASALWLQEEKEGSASAWP